MRPASDVERRRLNDTFARLCAIPSPFGAERACAEAVARELRTMGLDVEEDGAAPETGAECGNLLARDRLGARALGAERARDRAQARERVVQPAALDV